MKNKFFYQPDIPTSIICWSFTGMLFLLSMLLWLEITVFQIWTALTFILFLIVCLIQLWMRQIILTNDKVVLRAVILFNNKEFQRTDLKEVTLTKHGLKFATKYQTYQVLMTAKQAKNFMINFKK